jgi:hypothetical protein
MTQEQQHPITPPPELVASLRNSAPHGIREPYVTRELWLINSAYTAGANQELEACLANIHTTYGKDRSDWLRLMRRPKPPSLKEQALAALGPCPEARPLWESDPGYPTCGVIGNAGEIENWKTIRAALEALND